MLASLNWQPVLPVWLILLLLAGLIGLLVHGSLTLRRRSVPSRMIYVLAGLRVAIVLFFALVLFQPVLSWTRTVERRPEMLVLMDVSTSMSQPGSSEGRSRLDEVVAILDRDGLAKELGKRFELRWFAFDRGASPLEGDDWKELRVAGADTHFAESLSQAWLYPRETVTADDSAGPKPERVLLVSDGRDRGTADVVAAARKYGVAVDVLGPSALPPREETAVLEVADVQASRRVLIGSETHFLVTLRGERAKADRRVMLRLREGDKELQTLETTFRAGRVEERVRFPYRPGELGAHHYEFSVGDSAAFPLSVQVVDGKHEVLVLEDSWRWEFKFLRRVLEEDPSFRFTALLSRGDGAFMQYASPDRRSTLVGFPQNEGQLALFDTVIIGDVNPRRWPRGMATSLQRLVMEQGKSLVVLAGPNLAHWVDSPEMLALLPVEITRETANPVAGPVAVRISAAGARSPFLFLPTNESKPVGELPALDQIYPPLRKKPAATVVLEAARLANAAGPLAVVAEHTVGRGRVLYVGTDTLWKWQTLTPSADPAATPYQRFWQQSLRALTPPRTSSATVNLWLEHGASRVSAGQRVSIRAEINSASPLPQSAVRGTVSLPNGKVLPLPFTGEPPIAEIVASRPGPYRIAATVVSAGQTVAEATTVLDVVEARPELDGEPPDLTDLARIATETGGEVVNPADADTWPESTAGPRKVDERVTVPLWERAYLLILLVLVAGTDWLIRLLRGYV